MKVTLSVMNAALVPLRLIVIVALPWIVTGCTLRAPDPPSVDFTIPIRAAEGYVVHQVGQIR